MKIGFAKEDITPLSDTELAGYAVPDRMSHGVHDPLYCKTVVIEQSDGRYVLMALDTLSVDEGIHRRIADGLASRGIAPEHLLVCAIHTHSGPKGLHCGGVLKELEGIFGKPDKHYTEQVIRAAVESYDAAAGRLEGFQVRIGQGPVPPVGSERHTGEPPKGGLTVLEFMTDSSKRLIVCNFPCHPTVLNAQNTEISADFPGYIESLLDVNMSVFVNSASGDISTRFTRGESSFEECRRLAQFAVDGITQALRGACFSEPVEIRGVHGKATLATREVEEREMEAQLHRLTQEWQEEMERGRDKNRERILKSYVEGAETNLRLSRTLKGRRQLEVPVSAFSFCGKRFITVPGELFSTLIPSDDTAVIGYANGYYLYIADCTAYQNGYYEALSSLFAEGEGERFKDLAARLPVG